MNPVEPKVILISETRASYEGVKEFLLALGIPNWMTADTVISDIEGLIELIGRSSSHAFGPDSQPKENVAYIAGLLAGRYSWVLEHTSATFAFMGVSRIFVQELLDHRGGVRVARESLRHIQIDDAGFWIPPVIAADVEALRIFEGAVKKGEAWVQALCQHFHLDDPEMPAERRDQLAAIIRRIVPEGTATGIFWTANLLSLREVIEQQTHPSAEEESRMVFGGVADIATKRWKNVFADYQVELVRGMPWYKASTGSK